ncbi:type I-E CRISPR-associated protein Cas6/Cse3/CasE [Arcanobacterium pinnipediorum]|uniref:Type I-E CRISPR-associated protein Cas6/Cse3/CasE n=1 Tax=Arcanobacterium pinnipediorum TaxID=1503041 RepID=A0ABY5AGZ3_9ACTO|nr:type I-E CRISPR-associated protein Cas6/Cse3/CasE [Arcanobacterium pinnipediorum]USR79357.1 type I-E CRISPR-associated protein Cas6/Cse3/CasE [Arcanobacterium pinnipediorum]
MVESLYLTKYPIHLALSQKAANKPRNGWDETDPQFRHRAVMAIFDTVDSDKPREDAAILFRADFLAGQAPFFLIQSKIPPVHAPFGTQTVERKMELLPTGTPVSFRLAVNAIRRRTIPTNVASQGSHVITTPIPFDFSPKTTEDAYNHETMTPWLNNKLKLALGDVTITNHQRELLGIDRNGKSTSSMTIQVDTVDAIATVVDGSELNNLILHGVGRAKAYGCGLLTIQALA